MTQGFLTALAARPALNVQAEQLLPQHLTPRWLLFKPSVSPLNPMSETSGFAAEKSKQDIHFGDLQAHGEGW